MISRIKLFSFQKNGLRAVVLLPLVALLIFSACAKPDQAVLPKGEPPKVRPDDIKLIKSPSEKTLSFKDIKPLLEKRCIVCHGCYDAPCQLKLTSFDGMKRGAHKLKVYNKSRFTWQDPTRMFIDANSPEEWRAKGFFSVLSKDDHQANENQKDEERLKNSLIYQMLSLKKDNSLAPIQKLPRGTNIPEDCKDKGNCRDRSDLDISLDRQQVCPRLEEFASFADTHKTWGMPFAATGLSNPEYNDLVRWLAKGSLGQDEAPIISGSLQTRIDKWEAFFNRKELRGQLVSRYIYEHLVLGHIHFKGSPNRQFFRLVRSSTEPNKETNKEIDEIPTLRPYDDPYEYLSKNNKGDNFYYRLRPVTGSIVDKSHLVYELSPERMARYNELFFDETKNKGYELNALPAYTPPESPEKAKNFWVRVKKLFGIYDKHMTTPFKTFEAIPPESRYQFLLDDTRFFINGFIKGPVCRGLGALSSIEDHFWVFFMKPEHPSENIRQHGLDAGFLTSNDNVLHLPTEIANTHRIFSAWITYWPDEQEYMQAKLDYYLNQNKQKDLFPIDINTAIKDFVWDGGRTDGSANPNATLTIFRNLDSATVQHGLIGDEPETAWLIDYPVFERLHYLLVASYNPFGTLGHQAAARLYMDFLRTEGEDTFLFFLPAEERKRLYNHWHGVDRSTTRKQNIKTSKWLEKDSVKPYDSIEAYQSCKKRREDGGAMGDTPCEQHALFALLRNHVKAKSPDNKDLNRCKGEHCFTSSADKAMQSLAMLNGETLQYFPAVSYVRVGGDKGQAYTVIYNKTYRYEADSATKEFTPESVARSKDKRKDMSGDTLTVVKGLAGAYPNFFFDVSEAEAGEFVSRLEKVENEEDYTRIVEKFGVRRTSPKFWTMSDWFKDEHLNAQPVEAGILDLSRYNDH